MCAAIATQAQTIRRWNPPLVILGVLVALLGVLGTLFIGQVSHPPPALVGTSPVVVAARDLDQRTTLRSGDLTVVQYAPADVPPGAISRTSAAAGQIMQTSLKKGQPVLSNQIGASTIVVGPQTDFLPLPKDYVAVTVPSGELLGVAGYVQAGDYIDIIAAVSTKSGTSNVRTIYSGVRVIRVGPASDRGAAGQKTGGTTSSLTVAMTQCQAEFIKWFETNAALKYTLISHEDAQTIVNTPADTSCPYTGSPKGVTEADVRSRWPGLAGA
jgi:pilus assembly protein CpaB